eukprot:TRINITY_DN5533_c0_g1_i3.p1 TRINITY_DN5533_c0_g1~~TRINITY_DN5533_c0_g1_i3.p1  ORF type:complete len:337 (-),score=75.52 TRINITY_DN5533_c0_g1_i3:114-1124(-)
MQLYINPLMSLGWVFNLCAVFEKIQYAPLILDTGSLVETAMIIAGHHAAAQKRTRYVAFDRPADSAAVHPLSALDCESPSQDYLATTPLHKVAARLKALPQAPRQLALLVATGSYCPPHLCHTEMLECARRVVEEECAAVVIGGFMSPSHDNYVRGKLSAAEALPAAQRCELCETATSVSDWLDVDRWESLTPAPNLGTASCSDVARHLLRLVRAAFPQHADSFHVYFVCGADVAPSVAGLFDDDTAFFGDVEADDGAARGRLHCVCVGRDGVAPLSPSVVARHPRLLRATQSLPDVSSSEVRRRLRQGLPVDDLVCHSVAAKLSSLAHADSSKPR